MTTRDIQDRLASLEAVIDAQTEGPEAGLERLAGLVDADSFRRRLGFLRQLDRFDEARALIAARPAEPEWIEQGVIVAVLANDFELAMQLVAAARTLADDTGTLHMRCAAAFVEGALDRHIRALSYGGRNMFRYAVRPENRRVLETASNLLADYADAAIKRRTITSPLEKEAMTSLLLTKGLLHSSEDEVTPLFSLLVRAKPINVELGRFALDGLLPQMTHLAEAMLESHPESFLGQFVGVLLQAESRNDWSTAFQQLAALKPLAVGEGDREALFMGLSQVAKKTGGPAIPQADELKTILLDLKAYSHRLAAADHEARFGRWDAAETLLAQDAVPEDPVALWIQAHCDFARERNEAGVTHLVAAALGFLHDGWLLDGAQRASAVGRVAESILCLERLREYYPWVLGARRHLALKLWDVGRHEESIAELHALIDLLPEDDSIRVQLAREHLQLNEPQKAMDALSALQKKDHSNVAVPILLAIALTRLGKPREGFSVLEDNRTKFWADKDFLFAYMETAYAAGQEKQASLALHALNELRERGQIDPKQFRLASLDELLEFTRRTQERRKHANSAIISCQLPWMVCAEAFRRPIIWDWMLRTQEIGWLAEDPTSRAEYSIYASNRFAIEQLENEKRLTEIEVGTAGTICADYSALITLHHLRKLPVLFSRYRTVLVPAEYRMSVLEDDRRLRPHQLSHRESVEEIASYLDVGKIRTAASLEESRMPRVDEYVEDSVGGSVLRLRTLIDSLIKAGRIDRATQDYLRTFPLRAENTEKQTIQVGDPILIDLLTLRTLFREGLLEPVVEMFRVWISSSDRDEVLSDARAFRFQETARSNLEELWRTVEQQPSAEFVSQKRIERDDDDHERTALFALRLAVARNVPLLVDDRTLQAVMTNQRGTAKNAAFGSADLLQDLFVRRELDCAVYADCVIQLIRWRYKFIVPPAEVLHHIAARYIGEAPGRDLALVARYVHDCMNDPGLLGGLENSTPPISMALKLYITWYAEIGEFLGLVWTDPAVTEARSQALTDWVAQVMLPAVPISINERFHGPMARNVREIAITSALLQAGRAKLNAAVPLLLRRFAEALGVSRRRLLQLYVEVVDRVAH